MFQVQTPTSTFINVMLIRKGETYGRDHSLTHGSDDPLIQFFDGSERDTSGIQGGDFVAERTLSDLETHASADSLSLADGNPNYDLSAGNLRQILDWVRAQS